MPLPISQNPSDIQTDIPPTTLVLAHFANLKLTGDRLVHDTLTLVKSATNTNATTTTTNTQNHVPRRRRRIRRTKRSTRVHKMSDADLEAELAARRAARARERDRYARAIRSEKLSVLENELNRLRTELSRMDRASGIGSGTPPTARWESLPDRRRSLTNTAIPTTPLPNTPAPPSAPPPPPPAVADDVLVDPEKKRREKEERVRRREAKRKEREANRKPLTLAEIIKSAGPDPMKRLKPPGSIPVPDIHAPKEEAGEDIQGAKEALKRVARNEEENNADTNADDVKGREDRKKDDITESGKDNHDTLDSGKNGEVSDAKTDVESEDLKSGDKEDATHADSKPAENQSPTKITKTATSPEKPKSSVHPKSPMETPVTPNTQQETETNNEIQSSTKGSTDPKHDTSTNGTPNGNVDALAALSKLKAKLPDRTDDFNSKNDSSTERKRISIEEKRRLRRAAKEKEGKGDSNVLNVE